VTDAIARDWRSAAVIARMGAIPVCHPQRDVPVTVTAEPLVITPIEASGSLGLSATKRRARHRRSSSYRREDR
jgi:hypothetical protein